MSKMQTNGRPALDSKLDTEEKIFRPLHNTVDDIREIHLRANRVSLQAMFQIGQILIRDWDELSTAEERGLIHWHDRKAFWEQFADKVGIHTKTLADAKRFAEGFDQPDVERMINSGITWTHIVHLISLSIYERQEFLERAMNEGWSAAELHKRIMAKHGNRRPGSGKQARESQPKPPGSLKAGLKRAMGGVDRLNAVHKHALFCDEFYLPAEIENEAPDKITQETAETVDNLIDKYGILAEDLPEILHDLKQARRRIDEVLVETKRQADMVNIEANTEPRSIAAQT